jgi:hypothetical protein
MRLGTIVAWIGIIAFVLAIPMSIFANIVSPRVLEWWALTNLSRRNHRIVKLRQQRFKWSTLIHASCRQQSYINGIRWLLFALSLFVTFLFGLVFIGGTWLVRLSLSMAHANTINIAPESLLYYKILVWFTVVVVVIIQAVLLKALFRINRASKWHLANRLVDVEMELERLESLPWTVDRPPNPHKTRNPTPPT